MSVNRNIYCHECQGTGAMDGKMKTCPKCRGRGYVMEHVNMGGGMIFEMENYCDRCGGMGMTMAAKCKHCKGKRLVNEKKELKINVEKGMESGDTVIFTNEGEQVPDMARGDLIFTIRQKPHPKFKRV